MKPQGRIRVAGRSNALAGRGAAFLAMLSLGLLAFAAPVEARDYTPFEARAGVEICAAAAWAWAPDAFLVYVENDEDVGPGGAATRWGYLFYSPSLMKARGYSVRDGRILVAENLGMKFEAPPTATQWINSGAALEAADRAAGLAFRREQGGKLQTMLLMRGPFLEGDPDETTWTIVYSSDRAPSLFVVVSATDGKVRRTWRG
ncbi:MAG TPA: hypothetical protein VL123_02040 [Candidatus Udaeobacter sp.]|jgi:hypothetical protein|nr:hypothetical protein [Candidatus Udaeobacter sp.]